MRKNSRQKENDTFPLLEDSYKKELFGVVTNRRLSYNWGGGKYLFSLSNGKKFSISKNTDNYMYKKIYRDLNRSLHVGDSIFKPQNTDSIYVFRNGQVYYYIIGKKIN